MPKSAQTFSQKILEKIHETGARPRPAWHFTVVRGAAWALGIAATVAGGAAAGLIFAGVRGAEFAAAREAGIAGPVEFALGFLPIFWAAGLGVAILLARFAAKKTRGGWRIPAWIFAAGSVGAAAGLGGILAATGVADEAGDFFAEKSHFYAEMEFQRAGFFGDPGRGILAGEIVEIGENSAILRDPPGNFWLVATTENARCPEIFRMPRAVIFAGEIIGEFEFFAEKLVAPRCPGR